MKFSKMLRAAVLVAALMMLGAGSASATILTSPAGTEYGGAIKFGLKEGTEVTFANSFFGQINCKSSTIEGGVESQGSEITVRVSLSTFNFRECGASFTTLKAGSFEVHTDSTSANGNGILTSSGAEITFEVSGIHCIISTNNTNLGTVSGGSPAIVHVEGAPIPRTGGRSGSFCGPSVTLSAKYEVVTPSTLLVD